MPAELPNLSIDVDAQRLVVAGDLDAETADLLVTTAERLVYEGHRHLSIDCRDLAFCDSYGLRALERVADLVAPDGSTSLIEPSPTLTRILDITGLAESFTIRDPGHGADVRVDSPVGT